MFTNGPEKLLSCIDLCCYKSTETFAQLSLTEASASQQDRTISGLQRGTMSRIIIPYGPDRKPWSDTLSPLAINKDGTLMVTPPSRDPERTYDTADKERNITPAYYQVPSSGLSSDQARKAQDETFTVATRQASNFIGYQCNFFNDYSVVSKYLGVTMNNLGDPFVPGNFTTNTKWMERNVLDYYRGGARAPF